MKYLIVKIWGEELGRLVWDQTRRITYFLFNPNLTDRPDIAPLLNPSSTWNNDIPVFGDSKRLYQSLPPFLADSLPDSWGNRLFDQWVRQNNISRSKITPLYKLMFIGKRGMGALEFEPAAEELAHPHQVNLDSLYRLAIDVLSERETLSIDSADQLTLNTLLAVGTSAGGRQMKAIIAISPATGEIRSGQVDNLTEFDYFLIKFEDKMVPTSEVEISCYELAVKSGIEMEECRLINVEGANHFLTKRFDRKNGEKIHVSTLAAINPDANSYEDLFDTARRLKLSENEISELFRRMVFNILINNTDDHNKNFSFLLEKGGEWRLAPAYDMTFIFNKYANGGEAERCLSVYGKVEDISKEDLLEFAKENNIPNPGKIIDCVGHALKTLPDVAEKYKIPNKWRAIFIKTVKRNLANFGYIESQNERSFSDGDNNRFENISLSINSKGYYQVSAEINGMPKRHFIKPGTNEYSKLQEYEIGKLNENDFFIIIRNIFLP